MNSSHGDELVCSDKQGLGNTFFINTQNISQRAQRFSTLVYIRICICIFYCSFFGWNNILVFGQ